MMSRSFGQTRGNFEKDEEKCLLKTPALFLGLWVLSYSLFIGFGGL